MSKHKAYHLCEDMLRAKLCTVGSRWLLLKDMTSLSKRFRVDD